MPHLEAVIRRLRNDTKLDDHDIDAIRALPIHVKPIPAHTSIVLEGDRPSHCCLIISGFSVRSKTTDQGKRQILSIHIPGDIPDLQSLHLQVMDHDIRTLSQCTIGLIPHEALRSLTRSRPLIAEALWRETLIDAAIFREWIVNVGRRSAEQRLAHLALEMQARLTVVGMAGSDTYQLPMTQGDLADALGLTPVHVNRVMKSLRAHRLLDVKRSTVTLSDVNRLMALGDFNSTYLHQYPDS